MTLDEIKTKCIELGLKEYPSIDIVKFRVTDYRKEFNAKEAEEKIDEFLAKIRKGGFFYSKNKIHHKDIQNLINGD